MGSIASWADEVPLKYGRCTNIGLSASGAFQLQCNVTEREQFRFNKEGANKEICRPNSQYFYNCECSMADNVAYREARNMCEVFGQRFVVMAPGKCADLSGWQRFKGGAQTTLEFKCE